MNILIKTIPHNTQRYETVGDWIFNEDGNLLIKVSDTGNDDYSFLVGIHEAIEAYLCQKRGIKEEDVTAFDIAYTGDGEPGAEPAAPYYKEHMFATTIEKQLADELGIDWDKYDSDLYSL